MSPRTATGKRFPGLELSAEVREALKEKTRGGSRVSARLWKRIRVLELLDASVEALATHTRTLGPGPDALGRPMSDDRRGGRYLATPPFLGVARPTCVAGRCTCRVSFVTRSETRRRHREGWPMTGARPPRSAHRVRRGATCWGDPSQFALSTVFVSRKDTFSDRTRDRPVDSTNLVTARPSWACPTGSERDRTGWCPVSCSRPLTHNDLSEGSGT